MVVAIDMEKTSVKVSVSNSESSSSEEEFDGSHHEVEESGEGNEDTDNSGSDDEVIVKNEGWADSISKILGANKPKNKKTLVLSRAKKLADVVIKQKEEKPSFEVIGEKLKESELDIKKDNTTDAETPLKKKKLEKSTIRVKPNILERDRERILSKIATKGVVQLFNAVRNQQKTFDRDLSKDLTDGKKERIMKKFDKRAFLDTLMGHSKSLNVDQQTNPLKDEIKPENEKPRWNALRDDFMMGAKMKDWDKESVEE